MLSYSEVQIRSDGVPITGILGTSHLLDKSVLVYQCGLYNFGSGYKDRRVRGQQVSQTLCMPRTLQTYPVALTNHGHHSSTHFACGFLDTCQTVQGVHFLARDLAFNSLCASQSLS